MRKKIKTCAIEGCTRISENEYCASHAAEIRKAERQGLKDAEKHQKKMEAIKSGKKSIAPMSSKMIERMKEYSKEKAGWLKGKNCAVYPERKATDIHHQKGRGIDSYADQFARDNDMPLLLDKRFWLPVCSEAHRKITDDSKWAIEKGYSFSRL